jgi:hypothetical protein
MKLPKTPTFVIVGQPNAGKTTMVSTLAGDDAAAISATPGTTIVRKEYKVNADDEPLLVIIDTPGFQRPEDLLEWLRDNAEEEENPAAAFLRVPAHRKEFPHDCEILEPIAKGALALYVVNASIPPRKVNLREGEIIRLCKIPCRGVFNHQDADSDHADQWKKKLGADIPAAYWYVFNSFHATANESIAFIEGLKGMGREWDVAIANAVQSLRIRRENQLIDGARSIVETAKKMMALKVVQAFEPGGESDAKRRAEEKLKSKVRALEQKFRKRIKELFHHSEERWRLPEEFEWDLFSQHTWKLLGVSKKWIVLSGAVAGLSAGALLDMANGGASVGLGTLIAGVIGGVAAYYFADNVANFKMLGNKLGGHSVEAGLERRSKAASILLARLVAYSKAVANRPHGNRAKDDATDKSEGFIASLEADKDYPRFASLVELWHRGIKTEKSESAEDWFCDRVLHHISKS